MPLLCGCLVETTELVFDNVPFGTPDFSLNSSRLIPDFFLISLKESSHIMLTSSGATISQHIKNSNIKISVFGNYFLITVLTISEYGYNIEV